MLVLQTRSGLHLTHVVFSPNGQEVLLSYSGEHVYLMDAICGGLGLFLCVFFLIFLSFLVICLSDLNSLQPHHWVISQFHHLDLRF